MMPDVQKSRRENLRWLILLALNSARPMGTSEQIILSAIAPVIPDAGPLELRKELDYLDERGLVNVAKSADGWFCKLSRDGIDLAEYTAPCDAGIARPAKYW